MLFVDSMYILTLYSQAEKQNIEEALKINDIKKSTYQLHVSIFVQKQIFRLIKRMEIQVCSLVPQQWQCCNVF